MSGSSNPKVISNISSYSVVSVLPMLSGIILLPIYTRYLTPEDYGVIAIFMAIQSVIAVFSSLQLSDGLPSYYWDYHGELRVEFFSTVIIAVAFTSFFLMAIIFLNGEWTLKLIFSNLKEEYPLFLLLVLLTIVSNQIDKACHTLLLMQEKGGVILRRSIVGVIVGSASGLYLVAYVNIGVAGILWSALLSSLVTMIFSLIHVRQYIRVVFRLDYFKKSLRYGAPMIPAGFGLAAFLYGDKIILENYVTLSAIGIYAIAEKFTAILSSLSAGINRAINPHFFRIASLDRDAAVTKFKQVTTKISVVVSFLYLGLCLFSQEALKVLTTKEFYSAHFIIVILANAYLIRGIFIGAQLPLAASKISKYHPVITGISGIFSVALNLIFVPMYGIFAAATVTIFSFILHILLAYHFSKKAFVMQYEWSSIVSATLPVIIISFSMALIGYSDLVAFMLIIKILIIFFYTAYVYYFNFGNIRDEILLALRYILGRKV